MKAFIVDRYKSKDVGRIGEMPEPEVRASDVLVEVHAAGLNVLDLKIAGGEFKLILPYKTPFVLGHDVAGVVTKIGSQEQRFKVGDAVYARREDHDLETVVGALLRERGETVAVAESCTGGLLAQRLTRIAGSSDYFLGGVVAYANAAKEALADVPAALLGEHGAVSEEVASALASGARSRIGSDWGIGITGIAGPGGGTSQKPVGTVHVAIDGAAAATVPRHRRLRLPGDRERVRWLSSQWALDLLRRNLLAAARPA